MNSALIYQLSRFITVGLVNTAIDFGILRSLIYLTDIQSGGGLIVLNSIAFLTAVTNSYFMNKYWTFGLGPQSVRTIEVSKFLMVSLMGLYINDVVVYGITEFIRPPFEQIGPISWIFIAKMVASGVSLVSNFVGYKFFVFKK